MTDKLAEIRIKTPDYQGQLDTEFITEIENNEECVRYAICRDHDIIITKIHERKDPETGALISTTEENLCSISEPIFNELIAQYLAKVGMRAQVAGQVVIKNIEPPMLHTPM